MFAAVITITHMQLMLECLRIPAFGTHEGTHRNVLEVCEDELGEEKEAQKFGKDSEKELREEKKIEEFDVKEKFDKKEKMREVDEKEMIKELDEKELMKKLGEKEEHAKIKGIMKKLFKDTGEGK